MPAGVEPVEPPDAPAALECVASVLAKTCDSLGVRVPDVRWYRAMTVAEGEKSYEWIFGFHGFGESVIWLSVDYISPEELARTVAHEAVHFWQSQTRLASVDNLERENREREAQGRSWLIVPSGSVPMPRGKKRDAWYEPARHGRGVSERPHAVADIWTGERNGRRLCEHEITSKTREGSDRGAGAAVRESPAVCDNFAAVVGVTPQGDVLRTCAGHVPDPDDEVLRPAETYQMGSWERIDYTMVHPLTGCQPVALQDCTDMVFQRATAVAARLDEYDRLPKRFDISAGWRGTLEDGERLQSAGETTGFSDSYDSLREASGGAETIMEVVGGTDRRAADG